MRRDPLREPIPAWPPITHQAADAVKRLEDLANSKPTHLASTAGVRSCLARMAANFKRRKDGRWRA